MKIMSMCVFLCLGMHMIVGGQNVNVLSSSDQRKIGRAEKKISKGDAIVSKTEKYVLQIEEIEAEGKKRKGKIRRLEKKINQILMGSASFYKEGYGKKYGVFKKVVSKGIKQGSYDSDVEGLREDAKNEFKEGRKLRRKSANYSNVNKAAPLIIEANEKEDKAIEILAKATGYWRAVDLEPQAVVDLEKDSSEVKQDALLTKVDVPEVSLLDSLELDSVGHIELSMLDTLGVVETVIVQDTNQVIATDTTRLSTFVTTTSATQEDVVNEPLEETVVEEKETGLYFTVQFLADKLPVPKEKLRSLYDGPFEVIRHEADGWIKYSFGRFKTLEEANVMKERSGIQAYVVAYLHEERISMSMAKGMLSD